MKIVGLTSGGTEAKIELQTRYLDFVMMGAEACGVKVVPVALPNIRNLDRIKQLADEFDGFLFTGGVDVDPSQYGEERHPKLGDINEDRDFFEINLLHEVIGRDKPVMGICRGIQAMNVGAGGTLWQDIYAQVIGEGTLHRFEDENGNVHHDVNVQGSLAEYLGKTKIVTNSYHHQAVKDPAPGMEICAVSHDGLIESIASKELRFFKGYQWHPEVRPDEVSIELIKDFIRAL